MLSVVALWFLGYPDAALADAEPRAPGAREIGQAGTSDVYAAPTSLSHIFCGDYATATAQLDELAALAEKKGPCSGKLLAMWMQGCLFALTGKASDAVHMTHFRHCRMAVNGSDTV